MKDEITIERSWPKELNLKGNGLIAYAVIHNFFRDATAKYDDIADEVASWCGVDRAEATRLIQILETRNLIIQRAEFKYTCPAIWN